MRTVELILFGLTLSLTKKVSSESHLTKCCPPGKIFSGDLRVECVSVPSNRAIELDVLRRNATTKLHGLPQCDEPEDIMTTPLDDLDSNEFLEVPACFEILHKQITGESIVIVVHCRSNKDRRMKAINASFPRLARVRKCCPHAAIFDKRTRACVSALNTSRNLLAFLLNGLADVDLVITTEGPPKCKGPIVDYEVNANDVYLRNDTYSVTVPVFRNNFIAGEEFFVNEDNACLEITPDSESDRQLVARVCRDQEFCDRQACVRKCCPEDESFYARGCNKLVTPENPTRFHQALADVVNQMESPAFNTTKDYGLLIGKLCKYGMYPIDPRNEVWSLMSNGHVSDEGYHTYDLNEYCMDFFRNNSHYDLGFHLFICFDDPKKEKNLSTRYHVNTVLEFTSCAFLLMTLLVYVCLPSLQNLHGKTLMCHVGSFFLAFTCLAIIPWIMPDTSFNADEERKNITICKVLGYTMLFSFLSTFSWLNVMCFDIWWTFGGLRGNTVTKRHEHKKRFMLYCLYAWGLSFLMSTLAIIVDHASILPIYLRPDIGRMSCWFPQNSGSYGELTFFIGPVTIQLIGNVIFFILTSVHCNKVKAEIKRMTTSPTDLRSRRFHSDKNIFIMNIKLFIVMGISWICEVVSFFLKRYFHYISWQHALFYASDVFNCLQGLLIFILFVLKSRVYLALRRRLGLKIKTRPRCNATTTLRDPHKVKKSASNSTLMSTFAISSAP